MKGKIAEVFLSVQGEGLYVGQRQIFVRLAGCNLSCAYCDTQTLGFRECEPQALLSEVSRYGNNYSSITFTGGEPLLQAEFLQEALGLTRAAGFKNYLETNGTLPQALRKVIGYVDIVAMDFKLPGSTGLRGYWQEHEEFLRIASRAEVFVKAVVNTRTTVDDLQKAIAVINAVDPGIVLVLQPDSNQDYRVLEEKIEYLRASCLERGLTTCVIPQMHKLIGVR